jgi:methanogenic corrinoid protein MtbC1
MMKSPLLKRAAAKTSPKIATLSVTKAGGQMFFFCPEPPMQTANLVSASHIERETGFTNEQLRKWRQRYGFPTLESAANGRAGYSRKTIARLLQIKALFKGGFKPAQVVGKTGPELEKLYQTLRHAAPEAPCSALTQSLLDRLQRGDLDGMRVLLAEERARHTLLEFVLHTVTPLLRSVGLAWARNEIDIHHEHLCSSVIERYLHTEIRSTQACPGFPVFLLGAAPGESHLLGTLMTEAVLASQGAKTINIGAPIPLANLKSAAVFCQVDVVALSFSAAYPARNVVPTLLHLRRLLPTGMHIWAGGTGVEHIRKPPKGVRVFTDLRDAVAALQDWTRQEMAREPRLQAALAQP